jgi:hypothetical protein
MKDKIKMAMRRKDITNERKGTMDDKILRFELNHII